MLVKVGTSLTRTSPVNIYGKRSSYRRRPNLQRILREHFHKKQISSAVKDVLPESGTISLSAFQLQKAIKFNLTKLICC